MTMHVSPETTSVLQTVREGLQVSPDGTPAQLTLRGGGSRDYAALWSRELSLAFREWEGPDGLDPDADACVALAQEVETVPGTPPILISATVGNAEWRAKRRTHLQYGLGNLVTACNRAMLYGWVDSSDIAPELLGHAAAEYLVTHAILQAPVMRYRKSPDPGVYYNPHTVAALRAEFPPGRVSAGQFRTALSKLAVHNYLLPTLLEELVDKPSLAATTLSVATLKHMFESKKIG